MQTELFTVGTIEPLGESSSPSRAVRCACCSERADLNAKRISKGGGSSESSRSSIAASHEFWITSRTRTVASADGAPAENTPGCLTFSFLNSLERSPDEPLRLGSVFSQYHHGGDEPRRRPWLCFSSASASPRSAVRPRTLR